MNNSDQNKQTEQAFDVFLFTTVKVKVPGVVASNHVEAAMKAEESINLHEVLDNKEPSGGVAYVEWDESACSVVLVDVLGADGKYIDGDSQWLDGVEYQPVVDGYTQDEHLARNAKVAQRFYSEVVEYVGDFEGINPDIVVEIFKYQQSILAGTQKDFTFTKEFVRELVETLPSSHTWFDRMIPAVKP